MPDAEWTLQTTSEGQVDLVLRTEGETTRVRLEADDAVVLSEALIKAAERSYFESARTKEPGPR